MKDSYVQQAQRAVSVLFKKDGIPSSERRILLTASVVATLEHAMRSGVIDEKLALKINDCGRDIILQDEKIWNERSAVVREITKSNNKNITKKQHELPNNSGSKRIPREDGGKGSSKKD